MISPIQIGKTYGVLHTDSFFTFLGFAQKIERDETQKIDVYLDDKLIDTIEANEFIQKIDDIYDVENKAFKYQLPIQYLGQKSTISFKNHDSQEELLNSPYTLIDKKHEEFNEAVFVHSLEVNFDTEKIEKLNPKDSIGFLATEDNLLNEDFIKLLNTLFEKSLDTRFKAFYFNKEQKKLISEKFNKYKSKIDFILPKDIYDIAINTSIYIHSSTENEKPKDLGYYKTWQVLNQTKANMFMINIFEEIDEKEYSKSLKLLDNCKIEFEKSVISKIFEDDERYNEFRFMNSLNQPISEEIKNMYCPNSIGFLATKENLEDEEFMGYIKELMERFPDVEFKGFCFNKIEKHLFENNKNFSFKMINDIFQIILEIECYIWDMKDSLDLIIVKIMLSQYIEIYNVFNFRNPYFIDLHNKCLNDFDEFYKNKNEIIITNPEKFGFTNEEIEKCGESYCKFMYEELLFKEEQLPYILDLKQNALEFLQFEQIKLALKYKKFKKKFIEIHKRRNVELNR